MDSAAAVWSPELDARRLMVPVDGVAPDRVPDTFDAARDGARVHHASDILAPRGTPVLAADDGTVLAVRSNTLGGLTVYAVDPDRRFVYYYAHLERYREGLTDGMPIVKGEVLGYVGTTGNAPPDTPHLHFQVMRWPADGKWWKGVAIDARPHFVLEGHRR